MRTHFPKWFVAATALALVSCSSAKHGIFVSKNPATVSRPFRIVADGWKGSWAPDGNRLAFGRPRGAGIDILDVRTGVRHSLTDSGKDPAWSPDGRYIAFVREPWFNDYNNEAVWLISPHGGPPRHLCKGGFPSWSADGKTLYVRVQNECRLLAYDVDHLDQEPRVVSDRLGSWYPAVSPDGESIAFSAEGKLSVVRIRTGHVTLNWPMKGECGVLASWSPDGRSVVVGGFDYSSLGAWMVDAKTAQAVQLAKGNFTMPNWTSSGDKLVLDRREGDNWEIWLFTRQWVEARTAQNAPVFSLNRGVLQSKSPGGK